MDPIDQPNLSEAVERLWTRFLPQMLERVAILETAAAACNAGNLSIEQRQTANDAAHKLAGVLGTFDLPRGTILARELEGMYSREEGPIRPTPRGSLRSSSNCATLWKTASKPDAGTDC